MEKAPLLISIATSHYFRLPIFNKIFEILFAKILFQKRRQPNVRMLKTWFTLTVRDLWNSKSFRQTLEIPWYSS